MNKSINVSVIVPIYNAEKYLVKCLDSVVSQTLRDIEIILIDDGSTDGSADICRRYLADTRVIYYRKENEGLAAARQDGLERASGEYIGFVDSDDWIEPDMYERMFVRAKKESADVVMCGMFADESELNPVYLEPGVYDRGRIEKEILPRQLSGISEKGSNSVIRWSNCCRLYSMELIRKNNIAFDRRLRRSQDLQLTFETALAADVYVSMCDEYLYHNRTREIARTSLSRAYTKNYWELIKLLIVQLYSDVSGYKKQDLTLNMHLCTFFFAVTVLRNEYLLSDGKKAEKVRKMDEVVTDELVQNALKYVPEEKLNSEYRAYYGALSSGSGKKAYRLLKKYEFRRDVYKPIVRKILNNRLVDPVYRKIRHKGKAN